VNTDARPQMVWTALGEVQVAVTGEGPVLLAIHGQPGGYDQALALARIATALTDPHER
jgi:hypothetical protein